MNKLYKVFFVLILFSLFSCEIGLGSAVDTEPPTLNIVSPVSDAVIRDAFRLSGTWSDDGSIAGLQVYLEAPDGTASYGPFEGVFVESEDENVENTWYCVVDPKASGVPDGSYEAKISMTDEGEHTTTQSRLLVVDNTAPIIVLQRPSSKAGDSSPDSYGQTFTLEGQAADDNNVSLIRVNIFSDEACTQRVHYVDLTNVPPTISLDVAKFGEDNYTKIYGSSGKDGAKEFYCTIEGYDGSVRYPADGSVQTPEDLLGNPVHSYYLYEEIGTSILSQHKITEVYHMLNGSYLRADVNRSADTVNNVASILNSHIVTCGRFSLNPENNPTFTVSGRSVLKKDGNDFANPDYAITNGSAAIIEVAPGLDGISIQDDDSFRVYVLPCDANGNPVSSEKIYPTSTKTKSGSNFKFVTTISTSEGLSIGKDYIFGFDGTDQKGNDIRAKDGVFGFHMASSGAAPTLVIDSSIPTTQTLAKGAAYTIAGTTSTMEGTPTVNIYLDSENSAPVATISGASFNSIITDDAGKNICTFSTVIPASAFSQSSSKQYTVIVKSTLDLSTTVQRMVSYDVDGPVISIDEITPQHRKGSYNGTITINGSIQDDFSGVASAQFVYEGTAEPIVPITNPSKYTISIDTTKLNGGSYSIRATDKNGNESVYPGSITVDQNSDIPEITLSTDWVVDYTNYDVFKNAIPNMSDASLKKNIFTKNGSMKIMLYDDDGSATVTSTLTKLKSDVEKDESTDVEKDKPTVVENTEEIVFRGTSGTMYYLPIPDDDGAFYKLQLSVKDAAGKTHNEIKIVDSDNNPNGTKFPEDGIVIYISGAAPKITKTEVKTAWANNAEKMKISGENSGIYPFKVYLKKADGTKVELSTVDDGTNGYIEYESGSEDTHQKWTHISNPATSGTYKYVVFDNYSNESDPVEVEYKADKDLPAISSYPTIPFPLVKLDEPDEITFVANATDLTSGVSDFYYCIKDDNSADAPEITDSSWQLMSRKNEGYYAKTYFNATTDCDKYIYFAVKDVAGNVSYSPKENAVKVTCDKQVPTVSVTEGETIKLSKNAINGTKAETTLNIVVNDTNPAGIKYKINGAADWTSSETRQVPVTNIPIDGSSIEVKVIGLDTNGRESQEKTVRISCDAEAPAVTITNPATGKTGSSAIDQSSPRFNGTISDTSDIAGVYYIIQNSGSVPTPIASGTSALNTSTWTAAGWTAASYDNSSWNFNPNFVNGDTTPPAGSYKEGKDYTIYVCAVDSAGNVNDTAVTRSFDVDLNNPTLIIAATTNANCKNQNNIYYFNGTNLTGTITATDTAGTVTNTYKIDGGSAVALGDSSDSWTIAIGSFTEGKTQKLTIITTDQVGKSTSADLYVYKDITAPSLAVITPSAYYDNALTLSGSVTDTGVGPAKVQVSTDDSSYTDVTGYTPGSTSWSYELTTADLGDQGSKTYYFKALDELGNPSGSSSVTFVYDTANPVISGTDEYVTNATNYVKGNFTLSGTVYDSNLLDRVVIAKNEESTPSYSSKLASPTVTLDDVTSAKDPASAAAWSKEFVVGSSNSSKPNYLRDDTYKLKVTAYDIAGRSSDTITKTFVVDTLAPAIELKSLPNKDATKGTSYTFRGTGDDATSGIKEVYLTISGKDAANNTVTKTVKVEGDSSWSYELSFNDQTTSDDTDGTANSWKEIFATEGDKTVSIKAVDYAGNETSLFTYSGNSVPKTTFIYDKANPELSVNESTVLEYMPLNGFTISGTAGDSYKLGIYDSAKGTYSLKVTQDDGTNIYTKFITVTDGKSVQTNWNVEVPFNNSGVKVNAVDGKTYKYTFDLTDSVGNHYSENPKVYNSTADLSAPTLEILKPASATGTKAINENNYQFAGTFVEDHINNIYYKIQSSGSSPAAPATDVTDNSKWTSSGWAVVSTIGTAKWDFYQQFKNKGAGVGIEGLEEGSYTLYMFAVDGAGNVSDSDASTIGLQPYTCTFDVDMAAPVVATKLDGTSLGTTETQTETTNAYLLTFSITETNGLNSTNPCSITVKKDSNTTLTRGTDYEIYTGSGAGLTVFSGDFSVGTDYTIKLESTASDALYSYVIEAKDICGKTDTATRNIRLDTKGPSLDITSPAFTNKESAWQTSSSITIIGTASDVSGVDAVYYAFNSEPTSLAANADVLTQTNWTSVGWSKCTETSNWQIELSGVTDAANHKLYIASVDSKGNVTSKQTYTVRKDGTLPEFEETTVGSTGTSVKANETTVTLSGTFTDATSGLSSIVITDSLNDNSKWEFTDFSADINATNQKWTTSTGAWEQKIALANVNNSLKDGEHVLTITAKDNAGNSKIVQRNIKIDTSVPTTAGTLKVMKDDFSAVRDVDYTDTKGTSDTSDDELWFKTSSIPIQIESVEDAANHGYTSKITSVEYSTNATGITDDAATWIPMSLKSGTTWKATANCTNQGQNTIYVRVKDGVGNLAAAVSKVVYIDTLAPTVPTTFWVDGEYQKATTKLINKRSAVVINAVVADEGATGASGIAKVASGASEVTSTSSYTPQGGSATTVYALTIAKTDLPSTDSRASITITDKVGNVTTWQPFAYSVDTTPPEVDIKTPNNAGVDSNGIRLVNKTISFNGTASDLKGLQMVDICYYIPSETTPKWKHLVRITDNPSVWATNIDTETAFGTIADGTKVILCAIVTDEADNRNTDASGADKTTSVSNASGNEIGRIPSVTPENITNKDKNTFAVVVNQDTDRPVITFTNFSLGASLTSDSYIPLENKIVYGNILDDDGLSTTASDIQYYDTSWHDLVVTNGSFRISGLSEGQQSIKFKIKDSEGTLFETNQTNSPKLSDGTNEYSNISELKLKVDTIAPYAESSVEYTRDISGTPSWNQGIANAIFGGTMNKLYLNQFVYDANGIQGATVIIPIDTGDSGIVTTNIKGYGWTSGQTTIYTNTNTLTAGTSKYYSDIACQVEAGLIKAVAADNSTITITTDSTDVTYTKSDYRYEWSKVANSTHSGNFTYEEWRSPEIDVTGMATSSRTATVEVSDGVRATKSSLSLAIDNTAPVISLSQPSSSQYSSGNVTAYGTIDSATNMYYALSLDDSTTPSANGNEETLASATAITTWNGLKVDDGSSNSGTASLKPYYKPINGFGIQWFVYFDGGSTTQMASHEVPLKQFLIDSAVTTASDIQSKSFTDIVEAYLWIKAVDVAGNETVEKYLVYIDPQGDAPTVTIDYPERSGETLGGGVSLRGTATDTIGTNIGVDSVWVQIISAKENGYTSSNDDQTWTTGGFKFNDKVTRAEVNGEDTYTHTYTLNSFAPTMTDVKQWYDKGYEVYTDITNATPTKVTTSPTASASSGAAYYIKASFSGSAWSLKINEKNEFDPAQGYINPVAYRVYAVDKDGTISKAQIQFSVFDSDLPVISTLYLRQYSDNVNGTGTVTASIEYKDDIWVKDVWWLCGEAKDTQGLNSLKVGGSAQSISGTANAKETFKYKLATDTSVGKLTVKIEAEDKATPKKHSTTKECYINFDNNKPVLTTSGSKFNINAKIRNTNGFYSFGSQVTEEPVGEAAQSGFKYLAFWYERNITDKHVVYDIMRPKTKENTTDTYGRSEIEYSTLTLDSGLMWKTKTVTRDADSLGTLTLSATDSNIHAGGLCKIGGSIYMINSVSGTTISIDGQPEMPDSETSDTALFAMANVVNNTIEAGSGTISSTDGKYGYYENVSNDDNDHMVESVSKSGTTWTWEANINSQNIPDGSVTLHYVAFDAAGNYETGSLEANVSNNGPRLASLKVWSDFNENSVMDEGEYETYYYNGKERKVNGTYQEKATAVTTALVVSGNKKDYTDGGSAFMTVKAATTFKPEIVGGNGALYYSYKSGNSSALANATPTIGTSSIGTGKDDGIDEEVDNSGYYKADDNEMGYVSGQELTISDLNATKLNSLGNSTSATDPTWFEYTIYDSTEGCESTWNTSELSTTNRLSATFRVALNVQYQDSQKPQAWIRPFYWKQKGKPSSGHDFYNSIEWDTDGTTPKGHVELEGDLPDAVKNALGNEPKVSGVIKVEGYAFDDIKLKQLSVKFEGHSKLNTAQVASTYSGSWSPTAYSADDGWGFEAYDVYCNGTGHLVHWILTVDTAKQENVADVDKAFEITATDARGNSGEGLSSDSPKTQTKLTTYLWSAVKSETNALTTYFTDPYCLTPVTAQTDGATVVYKDDEMTPYYKVDVVPYVTAVGTKFAGKDKSIKGSYSRTSSGKYIVASNETGITLTGFNLTGGKVVFNGTNAETQITNSAFDIPGAARTGAFKVVVNGVDSINNTNNNNAAGGSGKTISDTSSYSDMTNYAYNRCPNNISNNLLTDDLWFDIWELNNKAATSRGALKDPVMHINQGSEDKEIGFGFVNAADGVSFPAAGNSYVWFQKNRKDYKGTNFVYDNNGVAHNISIGLDAQASTGIAGRMNYNNSNWYSTNSYGSDEGNGGEGTISQWDKRFNVALETIGIPKGVNLKESTLGANIIDTDRFTTPAIAVSTHGDNKTPTVYIMYYDTDHDQIRFRYGVIDKTDKTNHSRQNGNSTGTSYTDNHYVNNYDYYQFGLLNDSKAEVNSDNTTTITSDTRQNNDTWSYHHMFEASKDYYALVAGQYYKQTNNDKDAFDTGNKGSAYYGLDVVPGNAIGNDKVVMIWYDEDAQKLMYMYRENLTADGDNTDATSTGVTNKWSAPVPLVQDVLLQDCVIKVDAKGGIHIAYYDQTNADLIYGYMSGYNKASEFKTCVVDAYSQVGNRISIETAVHATNGKVVPYISYFSDGLSSLPKMAYLPNGVSSAADVVDGADADTTLFTGNWEVTLIPTSSVLQPYNVGIGVWKDADNKAIKQQRTKADVAYSTTNYNQKCYANGSSELVVGYSIKANGVGYMETAMRR